MASNSFQPFVTTTNHKNSNKQTSNTSAAVLAEQLNKPYSNAFVKNRYVVQALTIIITPVVLALLRLKLTNYNRYVFRTFIRTLRLAHQITIPNLIDG
jgi:hypothetical protein